jgi:hypothetical protein
MEPRGQWPEIFGNHWFKAKRISVRAENVLFYLFMVYVTTP